MPMFERAHRRVPTITDKHIKRRKKPRAFKNILTQKMHVSMTKGKLGRCKVLPPMEHSQFIYFWAFAAFLFFCFCSRIILTPYHNYYLSYNSTTSHIKKKRKKKANIGNNLLVDCTIKKRTSFADCVFHRHIIANVCLCVAMKKFLIREYGIFPNCEFLYSHQFISDTKINRILKVWLSAEGR